MPFNENWPRWIFANVTKYFYEHRGIYDMFIEGMDYDAVAAVKDKIEVRMDGPYITEIANGQFILDLEVNCLITCVRDDKDIHKIHKICGYIANLFITIPVFKLGLGSDDDQSFLGCLELRQDRDQKLIITHLGQIDKNTRVMQSSVEGHYQIQLDN